jgi:Derlin-2/3
MDFDQIPNFIRNIPLFTKIYIGGCLIISLLIWLGKINPFLIVFSPHNILYGYEFWRLISPFFYLGDFSIFVLFWIYAMYEFCFNY